MTAVGWLIEELLKQGYFDGNKPLSITNLDHLEHQAKEMEKREIINAFNDGRTWNNSWEGETYYKELYENLSTLGR